MRAAFVVLSLLSASSACAPKLIVRHEDPAATFAQIRLDGESRGFVQLGESMTLRPGRGYHRLEAVPRGDATNPWAADGEGWSVYVDRRAVVTLLPRE